jgi:hypothetical protein
MKKLMVLLLVMICVLGVASCSSKMILKDISDSQKIEIYGYETDKTIEITDIEVIKRISDNLESLKLSKMHYNKPTGSVYTLTFYDANDNPIEIIGIPSTLNWIHCNDAFYTITEGQFDRVYIATLFN